MSELWRLTATEAVARLRRGEVSPLEMVEAAAQRIEAVEPKVNALPIRFLDEARDQARRFRRESRDHPGWLAGLPIAVKDYNDVAGQLTTNGSPIYAENRAAADDRTVATLRANGAIPLAKSNVPEFAGSHTFNPVWGVTHNPWNLGRTAGGSSGGAAAALAAGEVWLANGSCLGGSLRIPASFCGIVGLRPSPGVVPRGDGLPAFDSLWVEGPMARNLGDLALMLDAMAALTPHDPLSRPGPAGGYQAALDRARPPVRIGFSENLGLRRVDPEVAEICRAAAQRFTGMGCAVEAATPDFSGAIDSFQVLRALLFADVRGDLLPRERDRINPDIVWNIEKGQRLDAAGIIQAQRARHALFHRVARFFDDHDLLVCPTVAVAPFPVEQRFPTEIAGEALTTYIDWMFLTFVITLTGCPAISLPCGLTREGLPVGLQLVGRPHGDAALLGMAGLLEQALGFAGRVPVEV
ncbi:amidase [Siccirubricoccus deserti]|uniref:Amidase n=1 Tax=Siccirubricoccus deserti TaxID=2013562 RepID=A0A9X0UES7_9PROT|nr:amidase family protein [Siccirubricoccus deserti]MBC4017083.1 amidase [Siccirubricoccus deserti]GGC56293.1 amidase [Siccirubricoccus deserti]